MSGIHLFGQQFKSPISEIRIQFDNESQQLGII